MNNPELKQKPRNVLKWVVRIPLIIWAFAVLYPLFWSLSTSLKSNKQFNLGKAWDLPKIPLEFSNYVKAWNDSHIGEYFMNSVVVTLVATLLSLLLSATTAYVIARFPFKGSKLLFTVYIATMMMPTILALIPLFFLMNTFHLTNSVFGLILVYAIFSVPFGVFILVGFFKSLPRDLEEAAAIDGAGLFGTFFKIMLPLSKSGLITVAIMNVLNYWNEYFMALILVTDPEKYTVPVGLAFMQGEMQYRLEWGALFAGLIISMIPVLLIYAFFQKQITEGLTAGAIKG